jgi:hypothetical protein
MIRTSTLSPRVAAAKLGLSEEFADACRRLTYRRRLRSADRRHNRPAGHNQPPDSSQNWIKARGNVNHLEPELGAFGLLDRKQPAKTAGRSGQAASLAALGFQFLAEAEVLDAVIGGVGEHMPLGDQLGLEAASTIARHRNLDLTVLGQDRVRARAVATIAAAATGGVAFLVAQMFGQFLPKCALDQGLS